MEITIRDVIIVLQFGVILYLLYKDWYIEWRRLRKIKKSGDAGEKLVSDYLDNLEEVYEIYHGLKGKFDGQHFEIDHLLLTHHGVLLIETKNIRGTIVAKKNGWCQIKKSESGKTYERDFRSPIKQIERTSVIFENVLSSNGIKVKVVPIVVFSSRNVNLKLGKQRYPVMKLFELEPYINELSRDIPLRTRELRNIKHKIEEIFGR